MIHLPFRQQGAKLLPDGLDEVWWECGHGFSPSSGSLVTPQMIERPAPAFQVDLLHPYPRKLLATSLVNCHSFKARSPALGSLYANSLWNCNALNLRLSAAN